jgi:hypothetical protein
MPQIPGLSVWHNEPTVSANSWPPVLRYHTFRILLRVLQRCHADGDRQRAIYVQFKANRNKSDMLIVTIRFYINIYQTAVRGNRATRGHYETNCMQLLQNILIMEHMRLSLSSGVTLCIPVAHWSFGRTYCFHLPGPNVIRLYRVLTMVCNTH